MYYDILLYEIIKSIHIKTEEKKKEKRTLELDKYET
jgi:hypothetical protein